MKFLKSATFSLLSLRYLRSSKCRRLRLFRKTMDCAENISSLRSSVDCYCKVQFWKGSLCHSCCKYRMLVARVLKLPSLSVAPFCRSTALRSRLLLSSPLCAPRDASRCDQLRLLTKVEHRLKIDNFLSVRV